MNEPDHTQRRPDATPAEQGAAPVTDAGGLAGASAVRMGTTATAAQSPGGLSDLTSVFVPQAGADSGPPAQAGGALSSFPPAAAGSGPAAHSVRCSNRVLKK